MRIGRYETERELGRGAMGVVYAARDPEQRPVALKLLLPGTAARERRFEREVEALIRMRHENVLRILDAGEHQGWRFLVTELIEGESLEQRLARDGPLDPVDAARLARDIARGLAHAHEQDVLHRDVKPSNVLIDKSGRSLLVDFGLTRDAASPGSLTQSGQVLGTPGFWSPEQARGKRALVGPKTDVFGAGATLYAALTQDAPAQGDSIQELLIATCDRPPTPPSGVRPGIDRDLEALCLRCLEKEPDERFESAAALADALDAWLNDDRPRAVRRSRVVIVASALASTALVAAIVAVVLTASRPADGPALARTTTSVKLTRPVATVTEVPKAPPLSPEEARFAQLAALTSEGWAQLMTPPAEKGLAAYDGARASFDAALVLEPRHARALAGRARVSVLQGDLAAALEHASLAVQVDPQDPEAWAARANVRLYMNEEERALEDLERALALAPDHIDALEGRGWVKFNLLRDTTGAIADFTKAIDTGRAPPMTYVNRAMAREEAGDHDGALADLDHALALNPSSVAYDTRARIHEDRGELALALADYDRALELDELGHTLHTRALLKRKLDDVPGARKDMQRSVELEPDNPMAWLNLGNLCQDDGDLRAAEKAYTRFVEKRPDDLLGWLNRGNVRLRLDDAANGRADLDRAVTVAPNDPRAWFSRGIARDAARDFEGAASDWQRAAELDERDPFPVYNRARMLGLLEGPESALAEYDRALERAPTMGQALAARGVVKQTLGDLAGAIADWKAAKANLPADAAEQPELDRLLRAVASEPVER